MRGGGGGGDISSLLCIFDPLITCQPHTPLLATASIDAHYPSH
jgi:hypothetical protein